MGQHTPGPLKAVQIIIENSPCTWAVQRKSIREQWGKPSIASYIDNEADARLFAAAPALYEALKAIAGQQSPNRWGYDSAEIALDDEWRAQARAAIAQAEGKE